MYSPNKYTWTKKLIFDGVTCHMAYGLFILFKKKSLHEQVKNE